MPCPASSRLPASPRRLADGLGAQQRRWLRRWFTCGAAVGLVAACASVALLVSELHALLRPAPAVEGPAATGAGPQLQLALPGVTLPATHALPLWLALAASLTAHEVGPCRCTCCLSHRLSSSAADQLLLLSLLSLGHAALPATHPPSTPSDPPAQAGHALAAAAEGVHVSGAGLSLLLLLPAAFVQLDSADLAALDRASMLRVATAGVWHNAALGLACWAALAALPAGGGDGGGVATAAAAVALLRLVLGYTVSLSVALAVLNMAPVHCLDGQQALEALLLRPRRPAKELPDSCDAGAAGSGDGRSKGGRAGAVQWVLHAGTTAYAAVVLLHMARVQRGF